MCENSQTVHEMSQATKCKILQEKIFVLIRFRKSSVYELGFNKFSI